MKPYFEEDRITIYHGDCREVLPSLELESVNCCVTSPPYWGQRDYGNDQQIGWGAALSEYVRDLVLVFGLLRAKLNTSGTVWLNIGDSYASTWSCGRKNAIGNGACDYGSRFDRTGAGVKEYDLVGVPWRVAFGLQDDGWYLRSEIIWRKPSPMPESMKTRPTRAHEQVFLLSKDYPYFYNWREARDPLKRTSIARLGQDVESQTGSDRANGGNKTNGNMKAARFGGAKKSQISQTRLASGNEWQQDPSEGANWRDVWDIPHEGSEGDHPAVMPLELARRCIRAGTEARHTVIDPFMGTGTTLVAARAQFCSAIGIEIEEKYAEIAAKRLSQKVFQFNG